MSKLKYRHNAARLRSIFVFCYYCVQGMSSLILSSNHVSTVRSSGVRTVTSWYPSTISNNKDNSNNHNNSFLSLNNGSKNQKSWSILANSNFLFDDEDNQVEERLLYEKRSNRWVLIVDDEEALRTAVGQFLMDEGYQVTVCSDSSSALDILGYKENNTTNNNNNEEEEDDYNIPDAIVLDVRMPGQMDGLDLLRLFRSHPILRPIPVVLLTARSMTEDRMEGYKAGADAYLPKPFDPEELVVIIDSIIARYESYNEGDIITIEDLHRDVRELQLLLHKTGPGNGWVTENVFFTPAERIILEKLCQGLYNKEIAEETHFSLRRVQQHLTSMFRKTKCTNRVELLRWAISSGHVQI